MAKRFTDTAKWKQPFFRSLPGPYKMLWDFLYHECDHAAIWYVDFDAARLYLGADFPVDRETALRHFNACEERVIELNDGKTWFIVAFIKDLYKVGLDGLNPENRVHSSVITSIREAGFDKPLSKPLPNVSEGAIQGAKNKNTNTNQNSFDSRGGAGGEREITGTVGSGIDKGRSPVADLKCEEYQVDEATDLNSELRTQNSELKPGTGFAGVVPTGAEKIIAREKSGAAYREFRALLDKHLQDGSRLAIPDALSITVVLAMGNIDGVKKLIDKGGDALEKEFRRQYERREIEESRRHRAGAGKT